MGTVVRTFASTDADTASDNVVHEYAIESGGINAAGNVSCTLSKQAFKFFLYA